jgi:hypothetical protein
LGDDEIANHACCEMRPHHRGRRREQIARSTRAVILNHATPAIRIVGESIKQRWQSVRVRKTIVASTKSPKVVKLIGLVIRKPNCPNTARCGVKQDAVDWCRQ